jgi:hypothetical protein
MPGCDARHPANAKLSRSRSLGTAVATGQGLRSSDAGNRFTHRHVSRSRVARSEHMNDL